EYLAAVTQQSGEDWGDVQLTLSTAEPMLNAAPPELKVLEVAVLPGGASAPGGAGGPGGRGGNAMPVNPSQMGPQNQARGLRGQGGGEYNAKKDSSGGKLINDAAALEQTCDLLLTREELLARRGRPGTQPAPGGFREGQSVTYHLNARFSV